MAVDIRVFRLIREARNNFCIFWQNFHLVKLIQTYFGINIVPDSRNNLAEVIRINENEPSDKQSQFFQKTNDGKQILRDMMNGYIPTEITQAEKQGFSSPDASWFKGDSIELVKRKLLNDDAKIYDFLDRAKLEMLVNQHLNGEQNRRLLVWSLLNVETWLESEEGLSA